MKSFLKKLLLFALLPVSLYAGLSVFLKMKFRKKIAGYPVIILGDSQTEFINLPGIYNRSINGSPYFVHYEFANEFIDELKNKKVYIACNYHNLSKLYQNRLANDSLLPGWRANMFSALDQYKILNYKHSEIRPAGLEYSLFDIKKIPRLLRELYVSNKRKNSSKSVASDTVSITTAIDRHWKNPSYILSDSIQTAYLTNLVTLLKENNCEVILLKMPLTKYYSDHVPADVKNKFSQLPNQYNTRLVDLNDTLVISGSYNFFKDYGHLNKSGDSLVLDFFRKK